MSSDARFYVEVRAIGTDEIVRVLSAATEHAADRIECGLHRQLNHDLYYTAITPKEQSHAG